MTPQIDHEYWAKEVLKYLVTHVKEFNGGRKFLYYGDLAKVIHYPEPYYGSYFANNIGKTLGKMGHLIENVIIDGERPPYIQALVVSTSDNLPGDGIKEFYQDYPSLPKDKIKDLIAAEYERIFDFGNRWEKLLLELDLTIDASSLKKGGRFRHNPYGNEGSPEHKALRDYVYTHPEILSVIPFNKFREYPLKSGDLIDVVFETASEIIGIEVKSRRSGFDDLERGIFQCIKYQAVLGAENCIQNENRKIKCLLILENALPPALHKISKKLNIEVFEDFKILTD